MEKQVQLCAVCAWREFCKKKYTIKAEPGSFRCPDFVRDLSIKEETEEKDETEDRRPPHPSVTLGKR